MTHEKTESIILRYWPQLCFIGLVIIAFVTLQNSQTNTAQKVESIETTEGKQSDLNLDTQKRITSVETKVDRISVIEKKVDWLLNQVALQNATQVPKTLAPEPSPLPSTLSLLSTTTQK